MSTPDWPYPVPEDNCWYRFFREALLTWHEIQKRPDREVVQDDEVRG